MGGAAALAHQDVNIAVNCSANAIENNFVPHLVGGAVGGLAVALEAAGVVEAGIVANTIWGALGVGSLMVACELTKNAMDETSIGAGTIYSTPEAESIDGREGYDATPSTGTVMSTPIADTLNDREGYEAAPKEYLYNTGKGFTPTDLPDTFILNSMGYEGNVNVTEKPSRVRPINNRKPINAEYAGNVYPLEKLPLDIRNKYPHSVPFTGTGHPEFTRYADKKAVIEMTGIRRIDEALANKAVGLTETPDGSTWHHHHDGRTMELIPREIHKAVTHTGGVAVIKDRSKK